jgi:hypothetical protein
MISRLKEIQHMFVIVHHLGSMRREANPMLHFKRSDEMDEKIEIPRWLCYRIETMCECEGRENSWANET